MLFRMVVVQEVVHFGSSSTVSDHERVEFDTELRLEPNLSIYITSTSYIANFIITLVLSL